MCIGVVAAGSERRELLATASIVYLRHTSCTSRSASVGPTAHVTPMTVFQHSKLSTALVAELPETVEMKLWRAPLFEVSKYATNYDNFCRVRGRPLSPLPPLRPTETTWTPAMVGVAEGVIPSAEAWQAAAATVVKQGFPASEEEVPVTEADPTLAQEKGWVFDELESLVKGGEAAYLQLLQSYLRNEKADSSSGVQPQSLDMLRVAEKLNNIPGNQHGAGFPQLSSTCCQSCEALASCTSYHRVSR